MTLDLTTRKYWKPTQEAYNICLHKLKEKHSEKDAHIVILDYLTDIMRDSQHDIENILQEKFESGEISDIGQSKVAIAGNNFQALIAYAIQNNILIGNLPSNLVVALKPKRHPLIKKYAEIKVGEDIQKPDLDLMIYTVQENLPIMIYSAKTSLRERAGQTYKWKLLIDLAKSNCEELKQKYQLHYEEKREIHVGFITSNFYSEINSPQQRGMLRFFDFVYLSKNIPVVPPVSHLSDIIKDLNDIYRK